MDRKRNDPRTVIIVLGVILGYRPGAGIGGAIAALALVVLFSFALSWVFTTLGLLLRSPNAVMNAGFMGIFPIVANEVLDALGLRTDVPWHATIGPSYVTESFHRAHEADSDATLVLNEFGYETDDGFASAVAKRAATLRLLDQLLDDDVPVHALGVQAHLHATNFAQAFEPDGYRRFLSEIADRGLKI